MHFNAKKSTATILVLGFVLTLALPARPQNSAGNSRRVAPVVFLESTKEQDGLVGPVRRVQTETAKLESSASNVTEAKRQLLEITTYDLKGQRTDNASYPVGGSSGKEQYKYDENGNVGEMTLRGDDGSILSRETYQYQIDSVGNWTKMITNLVVFEDGKLKYEPIEVTYRTITYYYDQKIAKLIDAHSSIKDSTAAADGDLTVPAALEAAAPAATESTVPAKSDSATATANNSTTAPPKESTIASTKDIPATRGRDTATTLLKEPATELSKDATTAIPKEPSKATNDSKESTTANRGAGTTAKDASTIAAKDPNITAIRDSSVAATSGSVVPDSTPKLKRLVASPTPLNSPAAVSELAQSVPSHSQEERTSDVPEGSRPNAPANSAEGQPNRVEVALNAHDTAKSTQPTPETSMPTTGAAATAHKAALELYKNGRQRFDDGDAAAAVDAYHQSLQFEPGSADVYLSLGHAYLRLNKGKEAVNAFKDAARINPNMEEAHYGLGLQYFRMENMKEAAQAFKKAITIRPDMAKAHYGLALAYQEMEKPDLLLEEYRILQTLNPTLAKKLADSFPAFNLPCAGRRCR
ncbi:MAG: tetratricopeptide repeat protein [bacterium]